MIRRKDRASVFPRPTSCWCAPLRRQVPRNDNIVVRERRHRRVQVDAVVMHLALSLAFVLHDLCHFLPRVRAMSRDSVQQPHLLCRGPVLGEDGHVHLGDHSVIMGVAVGPEGCPDAEAVYTQRNCRLRALCADDVRLPVELATAVGAGRDNSAIYAHLAARRPCCPRAAALMDHVVPNA
jgi:hypothetical protein